MSLREYNSLKKQYRAKHGTNPPKGTKLDELRKLLGKSAPRTSKSTRKSASSSSSSRGRSFWSDHFGRGGIR